MRQFWHGIKQIFRLRERKTPTLIPRKMHHMSRKSISPNALKVLYRIHKAGFDAYLVGGSVREILLKRRPKDFDIATNATPDEVAALFNNSRLIGRRFRIVHVFFQSEIIEVSTFRANAEAPKVTYASDEALVIRADNTYGTIEEDAWRRDFTVNSLYYNIADFSILDYVGGMMDLRDRVIRIIGDPWQRFHEDPVRLLRAIRLAAKLDFSIHPQTESSVFELSHLLKHVPPARLFHEMLKLFFEGNAYVTYKKLSHYHYFEALFPHIVNVMRARNDKLGEKLIALAMRATDNRFEKKLSLNPGFLLSVLLWPLLQSILEADRAAQHSFHHALHHAVGEVMTLQSETIVIPKRLVAMIRSIWMLQYHLVHRRRNRIQRVVSHRYFRAAYDFLALRARAGEPVQTYVNWWKRYQAATPSEREKLLDQLASRRQKIVVHRGGTKPIAEERS